MRRPKTIMPLEDKTNLKVEQEEKWASATELYKRKQLSSGKAAKLVGVTRATFLMTLFNYDIPLIDLTEDELLSDLKGDIEL